MKNAEDALQMLQHLKCARQTVCQKVFGSAAWTPFGRNVTERHGEGVISDAVNERGITFTVSMSIGALHLPSQIGTNYRR